MFIGSIPEKDFVNCVELIIVLIILNILDVYYMHALYLLLCIYEYLYNGLEVGVDIVAHINDSEQFAE